MNITEIIVSIGLLLSVSAAIYSLYLSYHYTSNRAARTKIKKQDYIHQELGVNDDNIANHTYRLLREGRYGTLIMLVSQLDMQKIKSTDEETFQIIFINLAQAHKWNGDFGKCAEILNSSDMDIELDTFKLAKLVLYEEYKEASELMVKIPTDVITKDDYMLWPLFREFRKTIWYSVAYKKLFNEEPVFA